MSDNDLAVKLNSAWDDLGETLKKLNNIKEDEDMSDMKTVKCAVKEFKGVWPSDTKNTNYWFAGSLSNMHYEIDGVLNHVCSKKEFEDYAKMMELNKLNKGAVKPLYTQEMADNGELPPVGSEVLLKYNYTPASAVRGGVVLFASDNNCILATELGEKHFNMHDYSFEPIDTRTDKEKLIDEVAEFIGLIAEDVNCSYESGAKTLIDKFDIKLK